MWSNIKIEFDKNEKKYNKRAYFALAVGIIALFVAPVLLSQYTWKFDFTETGQIGDTIGGTASPILSFIGALLVYYSFKQQMVANRIQINALLDEKQSKNEMQIVDFCDKIQREVIEKINIQKVPRYSNYDGYGMVTDNYPEKNGANAISSTLNQIDIIPDDQKLRMEFNPCFASIIIIFRNLKLLLTYINKIENETIQEMLINSYYNNLHLTLFIGTTSSYLIRKSHSKREREIVKLCMSIDDIFNELDNKYKVQNKWLTMQYSN